MATSWNSSAFAHATHVPRSGHLVVLGALSRGDDASVTHRVFSIFFKHVTAFFDDPGHASTVLAAWVLVEQFEDLLEATNLFLGLAEVGLQCSAELGIGRVLRKLRQGLCQLLLGVVEIPDLIDES